MSKETYEAQVCACGQRIQFTEQHWPHCKMNPVNMAEVANANPKGVAAKVLAKFSRSELEQIANHGPVRDEKPKKKQKAPRGKVGRKPDKR